MILSEVVDLGGVACSGLLPRPLDDLAHSTASASHEEMVNVNVYVEIDGQHTAPSIGSAAPQPVSGHAQPQARYARSRRLGGIMMTLYLFLGDGPRAIGDREEYQAG
jgi:hypothetical protein